MYRPSCNKPCDPHRAEHPFGEGYPKMGKACTVRCKARSAYYRGEHKFGEGSPKMYQPSCNPHRAEHLFGESYTIMCQPPGLYIPAGAQSGGRLPKDGESLHNKVQARTSPGSAPQTRSQWDMEAYLVTMVPLAWLVLDLHLQTALPNLVSFFSQREKYLLPHKSITFRD